MGCADVNWTAFVQNRLQWQTFENTFGFHNNKEVID